MRTKLRLVGVRRGVLLAIGLAGLWAALDLGLDPRDVWPAGGGVKLLGEFLHGAVAPAATYEADFVPDGAESLLVKAGRAALRTLLFAVTAASLSVVIGLGLGFLASTAWWADDPVGAINVGTRLFRRTVRPAVYVVTRIIIALARSTHELLWAVLFLSAMGLTNLAAVTAIVIPYSGTLAKVFSEMIDEAPRDAAIALRAVGASPMQVYLFGLLPQAIGDLSAYAIYRFECALRSSAVLGFFGSIPTLGYYIRLSFDNTYYHETWTYLYALLALVVATDWWSGALRKRILR